MKVRITGERKLMFVSETYSPTWKQGCISSHEILYPWSTFSWTFLVVFPIICIWKYNMLFPIYPFFSIYEIYCQIGFHTTPSAHPKRCPPQYPSPTLPSLPPPHQLSVCSQFLRVSYALALSHSNLFFFSFPSPMGFC